MGITRAPLTLSLQSLPDDRQDHHRKQWRMKTALPFLRSNTHHAPDVLRISVSAAIRGGQCLHSIDCSLLGGELFNEEDDIEAVRPAFRTLTHLRLGMYETGAYKLGRRFAPLPCSAFVEALHFASLLQEFQLFVAGDYPNKSGSTMSINLKRMAQSITWPFLHTISLDYFFIMEETDFTDFILRHSGTLTSLALGDATIRNGSWDVVFSLLAGKLPKSKSTSFTGTLRPWKVPDR